MNELEHEQLKEQEIVEQELPEFARSFLLDCKNSFEERGFAFYGFTKKELRGPLFVADAQYCVTCVGDSYETIAHGFSSQKPGKGLAGFFGLGARTLSNLMLQTLFENGYRLITTDLERRAGATEIPGVSWRTFEKQTPFESALAQHLESKKEVQESEGSSPIRIDRLEVYYDFPKNYRQNGKYGKR